MTVAGLAPAGVLFGFAAFLIATGLFYGLPLPVQPMKAISAVILTGGLRSGEGSSPHAGQQAEAHFGGVFAITWQPVHEHNLLAERASRQQW